MRVQAAPSGVAVPRRLAAAPLTSVQQPTAEPREWTVLSNTPLTVALDGNRFHLAPLAVEPGLYPSQKLAVVVDLTTPSANLDVTTRAASTEDLKLQLEKYGRPVDLLIFRGPAAQSLETAHALRDHAHYMVGAQQTASVDIEKQLAKLAGLDARTAARHWVQSCGHNLRSYSQSALDLKATGALSQSMHTLCQRLTESDIDRDLVYTAMMATPGMDNDSRSASFHQRDLGRFLQRLIQDQRLPEQVQRLAIQTRRAYERVVLDSRSTPDQKLLRQVSGANLTLPWKPLFGAERQAYAEQSWARESGWLQLLDHVFEQPPTSQNKLPAASLRQWLFREYKTYISPQQDNRCSYKPSCSSFALQSLERYGLWEGSKVGLLRFFSCDGSHSGADPVPGAAHQHSPACLHNDRKLSPSNAGAAGRWDSALVGCARFTGRLLGGLGLGILAAPVGMVVGAQAGYEAGAQQRQQVLSDLGQRYTDSVARGYARVTSPIAHAVEVTGAQAVGGGLLGAGMGLLGGALEGARWGAQFAGLWAENRTKDWLGQLPPVH